VRICQAGGDAAQRAAQFNVEFRVADATANPYLALAMLVQAGLDGVRQGRRIELDNPRALPASLSDALTQLEQCEGAAEWLGSEVLRAYLLFKRAEIEGLENLEESEICRRYMDAY
jgi:glutamine synthetase